MEDNNASNPQPEAGQAQPHRQYLERWHVVVAVITVIVLVPSMVLAGIQIYSWFYTGPNLVVTSECGPFGLPPQLTDDLGELVTLRNKRENNGGIIDVELTLPGTGEPTGFAAIDSYLRFTVTNSGDQPATDVRVKWSPRSYVLMERDDGTRKTYENETLIKPEKIAVGETITVTMWPVESLNDGPMIHYVGGSEKVRLGKYESENSGASFLTAVFASICTFLLVFAARATVKRPSLPEDAERIAELEGIVRALVTGRPQGE